MRSFLSAILAVAVMGIFGGTAAQASWKSQVLGTWASTPQHRSLVAKPRPRQARKKVRRSRSARRTTTSRRRAARRSAYRGRSLSGLASYYWQPQRVASGGWFNPNALTAAHKTLPFGTRVRVTNLRNGRSVVVRINDRGPYIRGRIIDLSRRAATIVGMRKAGVVPVRVQVL
ncbi:MAG: septal ring lytic transglycosylase RlpA family protein [Pseudomonadota bacterium]